uniref:SPIN90/Ldb17 leucine-rich domain-containing protein n=1 Tax=Aplanochytrium stocchinoi TaxID=215587 RepID=A0A7S3PIF8_9STRA|mmetsp:Transcript_586/g.705  ORF Transcript_586/g.705 Transcript_586/m.705 type:complete len:425 (-) Transcript_586:98-1372(-)|eukprot:CAMPEP_0204842326 /NCGR_PEP_ID=MMETSP1346-20131115/45796_1 /ASSEMBLY_ACC=CAM_ASM_000771 /TAXON_ID=215587 /ORGANISM="Aplanochytrium stocchinoi, Strain GSBS06" /LENGTH=424 /DNA_ID=CAMNT_0051981047 /DNA_START=188 /DNA_END=1462 /DNA_ORIENTATION=-
MATCTLAPKQEGSINAVGVHINLPGKMITRSPSPVNKNAEIGSNFLFGSGKKKEEPKLLQDLSNNLDDILRQLNAAGKESEKCELTDVSTLDKKKSNYQNESKCNMESENTDGAMEDVSGKRSDPLEKTIYQRLRTIFHTLSVKAHTEEESGFLEILLSLENDLPLKCFQCFALVDNATSEVISEMFSYVFQLQEALSPPVVKYVNTRAKELAEALSVVLRANNMSLHTSAIFRNTIMHECVYRECLCEDLRIIKHLIAHCVETQNPHSFGILEMILMRDRNAVSALLQENDNAPMFFQKYVRLFECKDYHLLARIVRILADMLLDKQNLYVSKMFIGEGEYLLLVLRLLLIPDKIVNLEAFHVLKVFVANPEMKNEVAHTLMSNSEGLILYIKELLRDDEQDDVTLAERDLIIRVLFGLKAGQ